MNEPTPADRAKAIDVLASARADEMWRTCGSVDLVTRIAAALAEEREKARAPFLRLLYRLDEHTGHDATAVAWLAEHIRAAAQEPA